jgi:predicted Zn-dependent peptidase
MVFKGTAGHTAASLARLVDRVGGDLNAWTDREELAFTCTVPAEAWAVAVEALCELCLHPTFPPEEFDREKEVIRSEILATFEDPEDLSYEEFLRQVSPGDWSRPVAGTEESLASITREDALRWWSTFCTSDRLTIAFSGGTDPSVLRQALEARLDGASPVPGTPAALARFAPLSRRWAVKAPFQMAQVIGGFAFPAPRTAREAAVWQIASMLWGETMSSRLFQTIREQEGLCYSVTSQVFDAEGTWGLQFFATCAPENTAALVTSLAREVGRLTTEPPTDAEWDDARSALKGSVVLGAERTENRVGRLWRQWDAFGHVLGADDTARILEEPVSSAERAMVLGTLAAQVPSLLVWGKTPRKLPAVFPWDA